MGNFADFGDKEGEKLGGIHKSDVEGGIYKSKDGKNTYLIKRDVKVLSNDIAEYLAAELFNNISEGSACEITLHQSKETKKTFLASKFFDGNYKDLYKELNKEDRNANLEAVQAIISSKSQYVKKGLVAKDDNGNYKLNNYEQIIAASLLLDDKSVHSGNIGVVDGPDSTRKLVRIDFGAAFRSFSSDINPMESKKNRVGLEKNYFKRDHPEERIYTQKFADELKRVSGLNLDEKIKSTWQTICLNYNHQGEEIAAIKDFGGKIGISAEDLSKDNYTSLIKNRLTEVMKDRQKSMYNMATEIEVKMILDKPSPDKAKLSQIVSSNPEYVEFMLNNPGKFQMQYNLSTGKQKELNSSLISYKREKGEASVSEYQNVKKTSVENLDIDALDPVSRTAVIHDAIIELQTKFKDKKEADTEYLKKLDEKLSKGMNENGKYNIKINAKDAKNIIHQLGEMSKAPEEISSRSKAVSGIIDKNLSIDRKIKSFISKKIANLSFPPKDKNLLKNIIQSLDKFKNTRNKSANKNPIQNKAKEKDKGSREQTFTKR